MKQFLQEYVNQHLSKELKEVSRSHRVSELQELNIFEKTIIYKYTENGYETVNRILREKGQMPILGIYLIQALNKLPNYKSLCYRAVELTKKELNKYDEAHQNGVLITEKSFWSCSKSKTIALAFCQSPLFMILSKQGKDIEKIAKFGIYSGQNEREILFKPGSKFRVLDIEEIDNRITIKLEEV